MSKLKELHLAAMPAGWLTHDFLVYFADSAGGFSLKNCPKNIETAELIAYLRNHAPDFIALIEAAEKMASSTYDYTDTHNLRKALAPFRSGK